VSNPGRRLYPTDVWFMTVHDPLAETINLYMTYQTWFLWRGAQIRVEVSCWTLGGRGILTRTTERDDKKYFRCLSKWWGPTYVVGIHVCFPIRIFPFGYYHKYIKDKFFDIFMVYQFFTVSLLFIFNWIWLLKCRRPAYMYLDPF
jgi:hypothetical protein